jgi:hypothetical protein
VRKAGATQQIALDCGLAVVEVVRCRTNAAQNARIGFSNAIGAQWSLPFDVRARGQVVEYKVEVSGEEAFGRA